jgi:phosphoenolpyruvate-protein phosphotransferase (PTS system enzyme I)
MRSPREVTGYPAADGVFFGPVVWIDENDGHERTQVSPDGELADFRHAVDAAIKQLAALSHRFPDPARNLLEVQLAWLEDPELLTPVENRIQRGEAAVRAWRAEMNGHALAVDTSAAADVRDIEQRILRLLSKSERGPTPKGFVLAGQEMTPTQFLEADWSGGGAVLLEGGSTTSHAAILARGRGVPMIVGVGPVSRSHKTALVDGNSGQCVLDPLPEQLPKQTVIKAKPDAEATRHAPLAAADGSRVELLLNINNLDELSVAKLDSCDGIGLVRSEFLFRDTGVVPDEDKQIGVYRSILSWADGKPVCIRVFDLGADKPSFGLSVSLNFKDIEARGVAVLLKHEEALRLQLRALLRASAHGNLQILLPMISRGEQFARVKELLAECSRELAANERGLTVPPLGVMVEIPEVAECPERFAEADFFALGTNDLAQFVAGRSRETAGGIGLATQEREKLLKLMANVIRYGQRQQKPVSICGDMASDLNNLLELLTLGARSFSMPPLKAVEFAGLRANS